MNLRIITKNRAADSEIGFLTKSILKPYGRATAMSTACEFSKSKIKKNKGMIHGTRIFWSKFHTLEKS